MKKFYCFTAGSKVPKWMFDVEYNDRYSEMKSKNGKVIFKQSVIAIRECGQRTKIIRTNTIMRTVIVVKGIINASVGGVNGATGIHLLA